jgi:hypothetical protein
MTKIDDKIVITIPGLWQGTETRVQDVDTDHILVMIKSTIDLCTHWFWLETGEYEKI